MTRVTIYRVDPLVQTYAKEPSLDFKALQRRYKRLISGKRFKAAFPRYHRTDVPLVESSGGGSYAHLSGHHSQRHCISLGTNRSEAVLLHEIAHFVEYRHPDVYGRHDGHGPGFAAALLDVVRIAQGAEAEKALRHLYSALRIRVYRNGRVGKVRAPGDAPEKAQAKIAEILGYRDEAADSRVKARAMLRVALDGAEYPYEAKIKGLPCECGSTDGEVWYVGRTRTTRKWGVWCNGCKMFAELPMPIAARQVAAR